jgi:hypothetical protein
MNDDRSGGVPPDSEAETVQPNKDLGGWQMPEPKFQQSSGYLPQGYLEKTGLEGGAAVAPAPAPRTETPAAAPTVVEPQPDLSEQVADSPPPVTTVPAAPAKQRSTAVRVVMVLLGIAGMIAFIALFLALIWYLFLRPADGGSPFQ